MASRIKSKWTLVLIVSAGQLLCLSAGVAFFGHWLTRRLHSAMRAEALAMNEHAAAEFARMISWDGIKQLTPGSSDWRRVQGLIERVTLPNQGFLCLIDSKDGRLICHPELRKNPAMAGIKPGQASLSGDNGVGRIIDLVSHDRLRASGSASMRDGTHLIAVQDLPELGVKVMAHQREAGVRTAVERTIAPLRTVGWAFAIGLVIASTLVTFGIVRRYENRLAATNDNLEVLARRRGLALTKTRDSVIFGLARLAESRDDETGEHLDRIRAYVQALARRLGAAHPELDEHTVHMLGLTSSLHDIGKVGIPDEVLLKPGPLDADERRTIEKHPLIGGDCLLAIKQRLGEDDFLETACEIAFAHHERWDGTGYPFGLKGAIIPFAARIVAVADVYDALTSARVYKPVMSHEKAREIILAGSGTQFDPEVVDAFAAVADEFAVISKASHQEADASPSKRALSHVERRGQIAAR